MRKDIQAAFLAETHKPIYRSSHVKVGGRVEAHCPKGWSRTPATAEKFVEGSVPFELGSSAGKFDDDPREVKVTRRKAERADVGDFGAATDRREAHMASYRRMSQEERAEWVYGKTHSEYVPPFVTPTPRFYAKGTKANA